MFSISDGLALVELYKTGRYTGKELAKRFSISLPYVYKILAGKKFGVEGLPVRAWDLHLGRTSELRGGRWYRKCCACGQWKLKSLKNFYMSLGVVKYGRCKPCHIRIEGVQSKKRRSRAGKV